MQRPGHCSSRTQHCKEGAVSLSEGKAAQAERAKAHSPCTPAVVEGYEEFSESGGQQEGKGTPSEAKREAGW